MSNKKTIVVTRRQSDLHACIKGRPQIWGTGRTIAEAVGDMIFSHAATFGVEVQIDDQKKTG